MGGADGWCIGCILLHTLEYLSLVHAEVSSWGGAAGKGVKRGAGHFALFSGLFGKLSRTSRCSSLVGLLEFEKDRHALCPLRHFLRDGIERLHHAPPQKVVRSGEGDPRTQKQEGWRRTRSSKTTRRRVASPSTQGNIAIGFDSNHLDCCVRKFRLSMCFNLSSCRSAFFPNVNSISTAYQGH